MCTLLRQLAAEKEVLQLRSLMEDHKRRTAQQQEASSKMIKVSVCVGGGVVRGVDSRLG
jgi:hypothetical protein